MDGPIIICVLIKNVMKQVLTFSEASSVEVVEEEEVVGVDITMAAEEEEEVITTAAEVVGVDITVAAEVEVEVVAGEGEEVAVVATIPPGTRAGTRTLQSQVAAYRLARAS